MDRSLFNLNVAAQTIFVLDRVTDHAAVGHWSLGTLRIPSFHRTRVRGLLGDHDDGIAKFNYRQKAGRHAVSKLPIQISWNDVGFAISSAAFEKV
jgi:hypothetical protein